MGITGDKPGATDYSATCDDQEVVNLTAPATATDGAVRYDFVGWNIDGADQPAGQADVQVTMDADATATAAYAVRTHTLTVLSTPITEVGITGDKPGATNYAATCDDHQLVTLTAPAALPGEGITQNCFLYWAVDNQPQAYGENQLQLTMDTDQTVMAVYDWRLEGDSNGDGQVNLLDIIYIRDRLHTRCQD